MSSRGRLLEWNISAGINVSDFVYAGASLIFSDVNYTTHLTFQETLLSSSSSLNQYHGSSYALDLNTSGIGIGGRFGLIVRPIDELRLGVSYQTPVKINLADDYTYELTAQYNNGSSYSQPLYTNPSTYDYRIITPQHVTFSAAVILKEFGLISADYELVNYSQGKLELDNDPYGQASYINSKVRTLYQTGQNLRIGTEIKLNNVRVRAGYAYQDNFMNALTTKLKTSRNTFTTGVGFLFDTGVFIDFAALYTLGTDYYYPYDQDNDRSAFNTNPIHNATNNYSLLSFVLSGGVKF
jgi:long-subunit fatty acid transport protein